MASAARPFRAAALPRSRRAPRPVEYNILFTATLCLLAAGAVMVYSASSARTLLEGQGDGTMYLVKYVGCGALGLVVMQVLARGGLDLVKRFTPLLLAGSFVLLVAVKIPGIGVEINGGRRWIAAGPLQFQPSELMKLALVLYAATLLATTPAKLRTLRGVSGAAAARRGPRDAADRLAARPRHGARDRVHGRRAAARRGRPAQPDREDRRRRGGGASSSFILIEPYRAARA